MFADNKDIQKTIDEANSSLLLESVCEDIKNQLKYDMSTAGGKYLSNQFKSFMRSTTINVEVYYPRWRWSKAYGYFVKSKPLTIHVNGYKFFRLNIANRVSLFYHEAGHACDNMDKNHSYNHGDNNPAGKQHTFQYSLNRFVRAYFAEPFAPADIERQIRHISIAKRIKIFFKKVF